MARIDIKSAFEREPVPLDFVIPGLLTGTVGALFSPGGTGKSFLLLEVAMGIACGVAGGDLLNLRPVQNGRVVYVAAEDPIPVLTRRIHAMGKRMSHQARQTIADALDLICVVGERLDIMSDKQLDWLVQQGNGARLIVIDTLSRVHRLDENSSCDMSRLLGALEYISTRTGAALIFAHHVSKGAARDGQGDQQHAARGSSVLIDNARWGAALTKMTTDESFTYSADPINHRPIGDADKGWFVRMSIPKNNYSEPLADRWFRREDGGVLMPVELLKIDGYTSMPKMSGNHRSQSYKKAAGRSVALRAELSHDWE